MRSNTLLKIFVHFVVGVIFGYTLIEFSNNNLTAPTEDLVNLYQNVDDSKHFEIKSQNAVKKIRILCLVNTCPANHNQKAIHVQNTWGKHCDKLLFASTLTDVNLNAIGFDLTDSHDYVWGKEKLMLQYVYKNFFDRYDWFYKADDDTFANIENLRFLLSSYSTEDPIYFGFKYNGTRHRWGLLDGGAGYAMSKTTLRAFVEEILTNTSLCPHILFDNMSEDQTTSICWGKINVYPIDGRDLLKRNRFLMGPPERHLLALSENWYFQQLYHRQNEGLGCCSNFTISFHRIPPRYLYTLYYFSYHFKPYGIKYRYPPSPKKIKLANLIHTLEMERINMSLRY